MTDPSIPQHTCNKCGNSYPRTSEYWYNRARSKGEYHVDHIIPLSRNGTNWPDNLALACQLCNLSKNNHLLHEWEAIRGW